MFDVLFSSLVDAGHRAVIFDRFRGVQDTVVGEGTHFLIPWVQKPIIFDCRSRPRNIPVITGSKGECLDLATIRKPDALMIFFFFWALKSHVSQVQFGTESGMI